jgi:hypothetical protein
MEGSNFKPNMEARKEAHLKIPEKVPFDRNDLNNIWGMLKSFQKHHQHELFTKIAKSVADLSESVGITTATVNYGNANEVLSDLKLLYKIVDIKERKLEEGCTVKFKDTTGKVLGRTATYNIKIELDREKRRIVSVPPTSVERL